MDNQLEALIKENKELKQKVKELEDKLKLFSPCGSIPLRGAFKGKKYTAQLMPDRSKVKYKGKTYEPPSAAATKIIGYGANGFTFWEAEASPEKWVKLEDLRSKLPYMKGRSRDRA